jgi:hypothetical protein
MIHVFILGYSGADYFSNWHSQVKFGDNIKFYYIDNGNQKLDSYLQNMLTYQTSQNVFCSGGWNLICDIAFNSLNLDKIIIGQEDALFTDEVLYEIHRCTSFNQICGAYDRSFEFSLFGIHKDIFQKVGRFDENFILGAYEDNDYKQRCKLNNINIISLNVSANHNCSLTVELRSKYDKNNSSYLHKKWGNHSDKIYKIYEYEQPFNGEKVNYLTEEYKNYFDIKEENHNFMSELEYKLYKNKNKQI